MRPKNSIRIHVEMIKKSKCGRTQNQFVKIIIFYTPKTRYADKEIMDTLPITVTSRF